MENLLFWSKAYGVNSDGRAVTVAERWIAFEKELWFYMGNSMCRKHHSVFQDHYKYMHNGIMKPFRVGILQYTKHVRNIHDLAKFLPKFWRREMSMTKHITLSTTKNYLGDLRIN